MVSELHRMGYANRHLESLSRRYRLVRISDSLGLLVVDQDMGDEVRSVHSLSGGGPSWFPWHWL